MICKIIPQATIAKAQIKGKNIDDIINDAYILISNTVQKMAIDLIMIGNYWRGRGIADLELYSILKSEYIGNK